ncbi:unnamed protein product, partial [Prorocentrum cordatum]
VATACFGCAAVDAKDVGDSRRHLSCNGARWCMRVFQDALLRTSEIEAAGLKIVVDTRKLDKRDSFRCTVSHVQSQAAGLRDFLLATPSDQSGLLITATMDDAEMWV